MRNKKFYISLLACLIPFVLGLIFYSQLPETLPIHWNGAGEIDGYANKNLVIFGFPLFMMFIHALVIWGMTKDPKHQNIPTIMFNLMYVFIPVLSLVVMLITINSVLETGIDINIGVVMEILIGIVFLIIGNYLPKCKQSYTVGIKTPWALNDEENWNKTHRLAGFLWIIAGFIIFGLAFLQMSMDTSYMMIGTILLMCFIPYVYSYMLYAKKEKSKR